MTSSLRYNDELREQGSETARWRVVEVMPLEGCAKLFDRTRLVEVIKMLVDINQDIIDNKLILVREGIPKVKASAQADPKLDEKTERALFFVKVIQAIQKKNAGISVNTAYKQAIAKPPLNDAGQPEPLPSRATVYRYLSAKRNDLPILKGDRNKGNRVPRYSQEIVDLVCSSANTLYLVEGSRWTLGDLTKFINARALETGLNNSTRPVSQKFVLRTINTNVSVDPEIDRMDPKLVAAAKSKAASRIVVSFPFERVEQDAVHLPFAVITPHGIASNIYLIHAIDCATGMMVGWHMMIGPPSESDGLKCVESILYPKAEKFKALGLTYDFDIYGTPHKLVFDNGPETKGSRMARLSRIQIDVMHCKSRHAQGKPYIERLNRSIKTALQTLPGSTRFDGKDGQRDPIALGDKLMALVELERWVVRWYYEKWAHTVLKRHLRTEFPDL